MSVLLRDASPDDAELVAAIYVDSWNAGFAGHLPTRDLTDEEVGRWRVDLAGSVRWRVAVDRDELAGFAGVGPCREPRESGLGELDTIAVSPASWRRGVGTALMADALTLMKEDGFASALLWTLADYPSGDAFYRRCGWLPDGASRNSGRQVSYRHRWGT